MDQDELMPESQKRLLSLVEGIANRIKTGEISSIHYVVEKADDTMESGWTYSNDRFAVGGYLMTCAMRRMLEAMKEGDKNNDQEEE